MKAILDGKLYDTEKAEAVIEFSRRVDKGPVAWNGKLHWTPIHNFTLYKTQKGAYFEYDQDDKTLGVASEEDARRIVRKLDPDKYMEMFGEVEEA